MMIRLGLRDGEKQPARIALKKYAVQMVMIGTKSLGFGHLI
jgi:hypothetical protein